MFYLLILESIGTPELILIGLVALIVFGPRKLPELARMLGKAMNEFRRSTDDFKRTWEQEIDFENEETKDKTELNSPSEASIPFKNSAEEKRISMKSEIVVPEVKEISGANFEENFQKEAVHAKPQSKSNQTNKREWL